MGAPKPTPPLPSPKIAAPYNLKSTTDAADCKNHLPTNFLGFFTALCDGASANKNLILTWNWVAGGCFPSPAGQPPPDCQTLTDIDGFHIYRAYLNGPGELLATVNNPKQTVTILPPVTANFECYLVQAFKGSVESGPSNNSCATFAGLGLTKTKLLPTQGAGFGHLFTNYTCIKEKTVEMDFPAPSFTNPPSDFGFNTGYIHKHTDICDKTISVWYEGMVGFDLSQFKNYKVNKATFLFHTDPGTNLSGEGAGALGHFSDLETASNEDCATGIVIADGYTNGSSSLSSGETWNTDGSMWYGSTSVAPGPFGGHQAKDVTQFVLDALAQGRTTLSFIFTADQSHPNSTEICMSRYDQFGLALQLGPAQ